MDFPHLWTALWHKQVKYFEIVAGINATWASLNQHTSMSDQHMPGSPKPTCIISWFGKQRTVSLTEPLSLVIERGENCDGIPLQETLLECEHGIWGPHDLSTSYNSLDHCDPIKLHCFNIIQLLFTWCTLHVKFRRIHGERVCVRTHWVLSYSRRRWYSSRSPITLLMYWALLIR